MREETKKKISQSVTGFKHTGEAKKKISAASKGRKVSAETRKRISESQLGKKKHPMFGSAVGS